MAQFADLYDYVIPEVRGVETETVDFFARKVIRDYLQGTTLWREVLTVPLIPGHTDYKLTPRQGGIVAGILSVPRLDDASRAMHNADEGERWPKAYLPDPGKADYWWQTYPGLISFNRPPDVNYTLQIEVFKKLSLDPADNYIPDFIFEQYVEDIAYGVKALLQAMGSKPWTDLNQATINNTFYVKGKLATRGKIRGGGAQAHSRVVAPLFAGR